MLGINPANAHQDEFSPGKKQTLNIPPTHSFGEANDTEKEIRELGLNSLEKTVAIAQQNQDEFSFKSLSWEKNRL
ncbi:MAG: hypothetical protein HC903_19380 [Methylacidiphilales bacterium]|nr:hypothetical protein [Candidatus Methylacidiphilales bacterium]